MTKHSLRLPLLTLLLAFTVAPAVSGRFMVPPEAPVERLVNNVAAYVKDHPDDAMGYYTLARIHYLAFALRTDALRAHENLGKLPVMPDMFNSPNADPKLEVKNQVAHLTAAMENFSLALDRDANNALFHLGLASLLDNAIESKLALPPLPKFQADKPIESWTKFYTEQAVHHYLKAYDLAIEADQKVKDVPLQGLNGLVSYEAGTRYLVLARQPKTDPVLKARLEAIAKGVSDLEQKPHGAITPIIFSMNETARLEDLLAPARTVKFDLDGTQRNQAWPWLQGDTAILVWDPRASGQITSGRQLFGNVTWWMLWRDGYAALDALDDNCDGRLSGAELSGLAVWFDRNGNGVSDPGEVVQIESLGVESIDVRATSRDGVSPCNRTGLHLHDGRVLATWDWVVQSTAAARH